MRTVLLQTATFLLAHPAINVCIAFALSGISISVITHVATAHPTNRAELAGRKQVSIGKVLCITMVCLVIVLCFLHFGKQTLWMLVAATCLSGMALIVMFRAYYFYLRDKVNTQAETVK